VTKSVHVADVSNEATVPRRHKGNHVIITDQDNAHLRSDCDVHSWPDRDAHPCQTVMHIRDQPTSANNREQCAVSLHGVGTCSDVQTPVRVGAASTFDMMLTLLSSDNIDVDDSPELGSNINERKAYNTWYSLKKLE